MARGDWSEFVRWWQVFTGKGRLFQPSRANNEYYKTWLKTWLKYGQPSAEEWLEKYEPKYGRGGKGVTSWESKPSTDEFTIEDKKIAVAARLSMAITQKEVGELINRAISERIISRDEAEEHYNTYAKPFAEKTQRTVEVFKSQYSSDRIGQQVLEDLNRQYPMEQFAQNYIESGDETYFNLLEYGQEQFNARQAAGQQQVEVALRPAREEIAEIFEAPEVGEIAGTAYGKQIGETNLGPGTKLRDYIESQLESEISGIHESTKGAREGWIERMRQPWPTAQGERQALENEIAKWASVAETAPSTESVGTTYFGPGGLKALAENAAQYAKESLAGIRNEDFPPRPEEEDPFVAALRGAFGKKRNWEAQYYRQPGVGTVSRLQPSVHF